MSTFTYTAKRGIVETGFSVTGTDISALAVDGSFNATTTDLSGVLDNEWILVSGFLTNAVNNGWHQVNGDSSTTKIIQDTTTLIDEAAGDTVTITGYVRGLDEDYQLETDSHILTPADKPTVRNQVSLSGIPETLFIRNDEEWDITTDYIEELDWPQWREFMQSVIAKEAFLVDIYGSIASPDSPQLAVLAGTPRYSNPYGKTMQLSLRVRLL